jgi:hypothetical protein
MAAPKSGPVFTRTWRYTGRDWQLVGELLNHQ